MLAITIFLAACGDGADTAGRDVPHDAGASVVLGTGRDAFVSLPASGGTVELVHGSQGGYHFLGRYQVRGLAPDVYVTFRVVPVEGGPPLNNPNERVRRTAPAGLVEVDGEWACAFPELVILTAIPSASAVVGRTVRWEVVVRSVATGASVAASRDVIVVDDVR